MRGMITVSRTAGRDFGGDSAVAPSSYDHFSRGVFVIIFIIFFFSYSKRGTRDKRQRRRRLGGGGGGDGRVPFGSLSTTTRCIYIYIVREYRCRGRVTGTRMRRDDGCDGHMRVTVAAAVLERVRRRHRYRPNIARRFPESILCRAFPYTVFFFSFSTTTTAPHHLIAPATAIVCCVYDSHHTHTPVRTDSEISSLTHCIVLTRSATFSAIRK